MIDDREAVEGIADHSCILYDTPIADSDRGSKWPEVKKIDKGMSEREVLESWQQKRCNK